MSMLCDTGRNLRAFEKTHKLKMCILLKDGLTRMEKVKVSCQSREIRGLE